MSLRDDSLGGLIEEFGRWFADAVVAGWGLPVSILLLGFIIVIGLILTRRLTLRDRGSRPVRPGQVRRP